MNDWGRTWKLLLLLIAGAISLACPDFIPQSIAQSTVQAKIDKSSEVHVRTPSPKTLNSFRKNKDFQYHPFHTSHPSFWDMIWNWIMEELSKLFGGRYSGYTNFLLYATLGLLFIYIIIKIIQSRPENLFRKTRIQSYQSNKLVIEDINSIDFESEIEK